MALHDRDRVLYESMMESQKLIAESLAMLNKQMARMLHDKESKKDDNKSKDALLEELIMAIKNLKLETVVNNVSAEPAKAVKTPAKKTTAKK